MHCFFFPSTSELFWSRVVLFPDFSRWGIPGKISPPILFLRLFSVESVTLFPPDSSGGRPSPLFRFFHPVGPAQHAWALIFVSSLPSVVFPAFFFSDGLLRCGSFPPRSESPFFFDGYVANACGSGRFFLLIPFSAFAAVLSTPRRRLFPLSALSLSRTLLGLFSRQFFSCFWEVLRFRFPPPPFGRAGHFPFSPDFEKVRISEEFFQATSFLGRLIRLMGWHISPPLSSFLWGI